MVYLIVSKTPTSSIIGAIGLANREPERSASFLNIALVATVAAVVKYSKPKSCNSRLDRGTAFNNFSSLNPVNAVDNPIHCGVAKCTSNFHRVETV